MRALLALPLLACTTTATPDLATGQVGAWVTGPTLPVPRANHCSAVIDDWVLVIGGNHAVGSSFVSTDEIDAAQIAADGTLGAWQVAGHTTSPVSECNATTTGKTLYIIDGLYDTQTDDGQVFTADLDPTTGHARARDHATRSAPRWCRRDLDRRERPRLDAHGHGARPCRRPIRNGADHHRQRCARRSPT